MAHTVLGSTESATVLEGLSTLDFLELVVNHHGPGSKLIICSNKANFVDSVISHVERHQEQGPAFHEQLVQEQTAHAQHSLLQPTLHNLSAAQDMRVAFCPETMHTLAYLSSLLLPLDPSPGPRDTASTGTRASMPPLLIVLNPIMQLRNTASLSAQNLARFFSIAGAAARALGCKLIVYEAESRHPISSNKRGFGEDRDEGDEEMLLDDLEASGIESMTGSVWDEEVGMLNPTTRTFTGDKGWQGRRISLRDIAGKWCQFERLQPGI